MFAIKENGENIYLEKNNNYTSFGFGLNIGSGLHYKMNESLRFNFEAIWSPRFNMLEGNKKTYPNIFIIQTGLQFKINQIQEITCAIYPVFRAL
ncbi:MAG: hypothetical protein COA50_04895 [Flavobacteriaceae bacterium]|nr:MAG: hypothetical protein COA50_04895 [Flavobacteriaceae bacterium]